MAPPPGPYVPPPAGPQQQPPPVAPQVGEKSQAEENLNRAKKLIEDLEKKGCEVSEAKGWYDQADEMFRGGLYRTSLIYSGYALDVANEIFDRIKSMLLRIGKVKSRAKDMLGNDHKDMAAIDDLIQQMKGAIGEGRLDDCQELINTADDIMRGSASPYLATQTTATVTVAPSRGFSSCPSCGNIVESSWAECRYCGTSLRDEVAAQPTGPAWTQTGSGPLRVSGDGFMDEDLDKEPASLPPPLPPPIEPVDKSKEADEELSKDIEDMEKVEKDLERVEEDIGGERVEDPKDMGTPANPRSAFSIPLPPRVDDLDGPTVPDGPDTGALRCASCGEELEPGWARCPTCQSPRPGP